MTPTFVIASPNKVRAKQSLCCPFPCHCERSEAISHCVSLRLPRPLRGLAMTDSVEIATAALRPRNDETEGVLRNDTLGITSSPVVMPRTPGWQFFL